MEQPINLKTLAVRGAFAYSSRQVITLSLNLVTSLMLMRLLLPSDFGNAALVSVVISFSTILSEGGLGLALIQRKDTVSDHDLSQIISFQMLLWLFFQMILTACVASLFILKGSYFMWLLLWCASASIPSSLMRSASFILLDRSLAISKVAVIEVCEQVIYSVVAITLAFYGFGVWSFICGWILKPLVGWQLARFYAHWHWSFYCRPHSFCGLRKVIKKGLLYQLPSILETVRASINPIFIRSLLGAASAGFVDRAMLFASMPVNIMSGVWSKILFPYFSRMQDDKEEARRVFEQSVYLHSIIDKAIYLPFVTFLPELIITVIGSKWLPIAPLMYILIGCSTAFCAFSTTSSALINGLGKPVVLARWSSVQICVAWVLSVILVRSFGIMGYALVSFFLCLGVFYLSRHVRLLIGNFKVFEKIAKPMLASYATLLLMLFLKTWFTQSVLTVAIIVLLSIAELSCYFLLLYLLDWKQMNFMTRRIYQIVSGPLCAEKI